MIEWFTRNAGSSVSLGSGDSSAVLYGCARPDWVVLPLELSGERVRVIGEGVGTCPSGDHDVSHYRLERGLCVAECPEHGGFIWYREPES